MAIDNINIECAVNIDDIIAWNDYYWQNDSKRKLTQRLVRFVFIPIMALFFILGIFLLFAYIITGTGSYDLFLFPIILGGGGILYGIFSPKFKRGIYKNVIVKNYGQGKNGVVGKHKYSFTREGIHDVTAVDETMLKWDAIEKIALTKNHMFLIIRPMTALIIPKKEFSNDSAFDQLVNSTNDLFNNYKNTHNA